MQVINLTTRPSMTHSNHVNDKYVHTQQCVAHLIIYQTLNIAQLAFIRINVLVLIHMMLPILQIFSHIIRLSNMSQGCPYANKCHSFIEKVTRTLVTYFIECMQNMVTGYVQSTCRTHARAHGSSLALTGAHSHTYELTKCHSFIKKVTRTLVTYFIEFMYT